MRFNLAGSKPLDNERAKLLNNSHPRTVPDWVNSNRFDFTEYYNQYVGPWANGKNKSRLLSYAGIDFSYLFNDCIILNESGSITFGGFTKATFYQKGSAYSGVLEECTISKYFNRLPIYFNSALAGAKDSSWYAGEDFHFYIGMSGTVTNNMTWNVGVENIADVELSNRGYNFLTDLSALILLQSGSFYIHTDNMYAAWRSGSRLSVLFPNMDSPTIIKNAAQLVTGFYRKVFDSKLPELFGSNNSFSITAKNEIIAYNPTSVKEDVHYLTISEFMYYLTYYLKTIMIDFNGNSIYVKSGYAASNYMCFTPVEISSDSPLISDNSEIEVRNLKHIINNRVERTYDDNNLRSSDNNEAARPFSIVGKDSLDLYDIRKINISLSEVGIPDDEVVYDKIEVSNFMVDDYSYESMVNDIDSFIDYLHSLEDGDSMYTGILGGGSINIDASDNGIGILSYKIYAASLFTATFNDSSDYKYITVLEEITGNEPSGKVKAYRTKEKYGYITGSYQGFSNLNVTSAVLVSQQLVIAPMFSDRGVTTLRDENGNTLPYTPADGNILMTPSGFDGDYSWIGSKNIEFKFDSAYKNYYYPNGLMLINSRFDYYVNQQSIRHSSGGASNIVTLNHDYDRSYYVKFMLPARDKGYAATSNVNILATNVTLEYLDVEESIIMTTRTSPLSINGFIQESNGHIIEGYGELVLQLDIDTLKEPTFKPYYSQSIEEIDSLEMLKQFLTMHILERTNFYKLLVKGVQPEDGYSPYLLAKSYDYMNDNMSHNANSLLSFISSISEYLTIGSIDDLNEDLSSELMLTDGNNDVNDVINDYYYYLDETGEILTTSYDGIQSLGDISFIRESEIQAAVQDLLAGTNLHIDSLNIGSNNIIDDNGVTVKKDLTLKDAIILYHLSDDNSNYEALLDGYFHSLLSLNEGYQLYQFEGQMLDTIQEYINGLEDPSVVTFSDISVILQSYYDETCSQIGTLQDDTSRYTEEILSSASRALNQAKASTLSTMTNLKISTGSFVDSMGYKLGAFSRKIQESASSATSALSNFLGLGKSTDDAGWISNGEISNKSNMELALDINFDENKLKSFCESMGNMIEKGLTWCYDKIDAFMTSTFQDGVSFKIMNNGYECCDAPCYQKQFSSLQELAVVYPNLANKMREYEEKYPEIQAYTLSTQLHNLLIFAQKYNDYYVITTSLVMMNYSIAADSKSDYDFAMEMATQRVILEKSYNALLDQIKYYESYIKLQFLSSFNGNFTSFSKITIYSEGYYLNLILEGAKTPQKEYKAAKMAGWILAGIGAVLCCTGVASGVGAALIVVGLAGVAGATAAEGSSVTSNYEDIVNECKHDVTFANKEITSVELYNLSIGVQDHISEFYLTCLDLLVLGNYVHAGDGNKVDGEYIPLAITPGTPDVRLRLITDVDRAKQTRVKLAILGGILFTTFMSFRMKTKRLRTKKKYLKNEKKIRELKEPDPMNYIIRDDNGKVDVNLSEKTYSDALNKYNKRIDKYSRRQCKLGWKLGAITAEKIPDKKDVLTGLNIIKGIVQSESINDGVSNGLSVLGDSVNLEFSSAKSERSALNNKLAVVDDNVVQKYGLIDTTLKKLEGDMDSKLDILNENLATHDNKVYNNLININDPINNKLVILNETIELNNTKLESLINLINDDSESNPLKYGVLNVLATGAGISVGALVVMIVQSLSDSSTIKDAINSLKKKMATSKSSHGV